MEELGPTPFDLGQSAGLLGGDDRSDSDVLFVEHEAVEKRLSLGLLRIEERSL